MSKKPRNTEKTEQSRLFKEKAREIGADRTGGDDEVMRRLAKQKRHEPQEKQKPSRED